MSPGSAPQHDPVLRARIQVPDLPVGTVERVALLDRLDENPHGQPRVLVAHAPAGFGKTTLLTQWARRTAAAGLPVAWLTASARDADPASLFAGLRDAAAVALAHHAPAIQA